MKKSTHFYHQRFCISKAMMRGLILVGVAGSLLFADRGYEVSFYPSIPRAEYVDQDLKEESVSDEAFCSHVIQDDAGLYEFVWGETGVLSQMKSVVIHAQLSELSGVADDDCMQIIDDLTNVLHEMAITVVPKKTIVDEKGGEQ